nr:solute carrier family 2, facilitated glucose transporter member 5-like isoform X1 [Pogona vitticeps]XP_020637903.1 solute carrier family 2, facilitated glucose transporter member 5-like isoform X1 [Pogona vitticeps]
MDHDAEDLGEHHRSSISPIKGTGEEPEGAERELPKPVMSPMESTTKEPEVTESKPPKSTTSTRRSSTQELELPRMEPQTSVTSSVGRSPKDLRVAKREPRSSLPSPAGSRTQMLSVQASLEPRRSNVSAKRSRTKSMETKKKTSPKWAQLTKPLVMVAVITSFGSSLQHGYNIWVVNHPATLIQDFYNVTYHQKKITLNKGFLSFLYNLTTALFSLGGLIGSLLASLLVDRFGRRGALILNNILSMISALLMGFSSIVFASEYTIFTRLLTGICSGVFSCVVPMYLGEVAPKMLRGTVISVSMVFVAVGMLFSQILGLREILGNKKEWPILLSLMGFLALFQVLVLPCLPESPRYLLIQKRNEVKARQALQRLRCQESVDEELEEMYQEDAVEKTEKVMGGLKILYYRGLRWQVISVIILMGGQQLSGINAANYYAERVYATMWLTEYDARYISITSTFSLIIVLLFVVYFIDTVGRRVLILIGFAICSILCVLLTMTLELQSTMSWMSYISSGLIFAFLIGHIIGPGPVPNVLITELFLQSSRSTGFAIGGFVHWLLNFLTGMIFLHIEKQLGSYSFLIFWPFSFGTFLFLFKIIPETRGKSFLDIKRLMTAHVARRIQVQDSRRGSTQPSSRRPSLPPGSRRVSLTPGSRRDSLPPSSRRGSVQQNVKRKKRKATTKPT